MMTKSQKIILCVVSAIAGLLFGSAIYYYNKVQARKQVFEQEAIEQKKENNVMEQKIGSPAKVCGLCIDSCKSKQEEFSINDAPKLCSELLDLCIEGFCSSIG